MPCKTKRPDGLLCWEKWAQRQVCAWRCWLLVAGCCHWPELVASIRKNRPKTSSLVHRQISKSYTLARGGQVASPLPRTNSAAPTNGLPSRFPTTCLLIEPPRVPHIRISWPLSVRLFAKATRQHVSFRPVDRRRWWFVVVRAARAEPTAGSERRWPFRCRTTATTTTKQARCWWSLWGASATKRHDGRWALWTAGAATKHDPHHGRRPFWCCATE